MGYSRYILAITAFHIPSIKKAGAIAFRYQLFSFSYIDLCQLESISGHAALGHKTVTRSLPVRLLV